ncbi:MAG: UbiA family prenyltransferase [Planctomycetes bacterium]|nr:UbiA family prenyltransferase [Planctomycetota bacterium]MCB9904017.1 UbiA family prenyltransferase [Planctomycetota bacterium]
MLLGCGGVFPGFADTALLVAGSSFVYHGNLALNDWCDREHDAATRPDRPIPSGAVSESAALALATALTLLGVLCAALAAPWAGAWMAGVALLAGLYNRRGRGPHAGPLLLALCRAGNLTTGTLYAFVAGYEPSFVHSGLAALLYGGYVYQVSRLGRLEDGEDEDVDPQRIGGFLFSAAALLLAAGFAPRGAADQVAQFPAVLLASGGAVALIREPLRSADWSAARVGRCMGLCLRRLLLFTAIFAWNTSTVAGAWTAGALLLGYPLAWSLRRWFPPS